MAGGHGASAAVPFSSGYMEEHDDCARFNNRGLSAQKPLTASFVASLESDVSGKYSGMGA